METSPPIVSKSPLYILKSNRENVVALDFVFQHSLDFVLGSSGEEPEKLYGEKQQPRDTGFELDPATV